MWGHNPRGGMKGRPRTLTPMAAALLRRWPSQPRQRKLPEVIMNRVDMYFDALVAAFVRGKLAADNPSGSAHDRLWQRPLEDLSSDDVDQLIRLGKEAGLRLHKFKWTMELPRVRRVLGVLKGLSPTDLLDVGSGRGTFLWPLLDSFPHLPVLAIDRDARRVADIVAVRDGGFSK